MTAVRIAGGLAVLALAALTVHFSPDGPQMAVLGAFGLGWMAHSLWRP